MSEPALSEIAVARHRPAEEIASLLSGVALFDGLAPEELAGCEESVVRVELAPGEILWRQATHDRGLYVLLTGEAQVCRRLPGERELELARLGPGDVIGEVVLLGASAHSATVRAVGTCSLLFLSREQFDARTLLGDRCALELRRRIVATVCERLRRTYGAVAETIDRAAPDCAGALAGMRHAQLLPAALPPLAYLSRLPLFRGLAPDLVAELLGRARPLYVPRGEIVQHRGAQPRSCYVVVNGAVEEVVYRDGASLRVGFSGPGHLFGHLGLLDGKPAAVSSVTRERSLLLAIGGEKFETLIRGRGAPSRAFNAAIEADLIRSLEIAARARSRLAAGRYS